MARWSENLWKKCLKIVLWIKKFLSCAGIIFFSVEFYKFRDEPIGKNKRCAGIHDKANEQHNVSGVVCICGV